MFYTSVLLHFTDCCVRREVEGASFDWFKSYSDIAHIVREAIPDKASRILMLGCGNSKLSEEMYDDGYHNIVNVDVRVQLHKPKPVAKIQ